jgi:hypothetical protein
VYVVVAVGVTSREPRVPTVPTPGSIDTEYAFSTSHCSVADAPGAMRVGGVVNARMIAGGLGGGAPGNPAGGGA